MTPEQLSAMYEEEVNKQRVLAKEAAYTHEALLFVVQALRELVGNLGFMQLLRAAGLQSMPRVLAIERFEEAEQ